jgi:hypothetical protein
MTNTPNDINNPDFSNAFAIMDPETLRILREPLDVSVVHSESIITEFLNSYEDWIKSTQNNSLVGLDLYKIKAYSNGTSESFDKFYLKNRTRRFRCYKGEYVYHKLAWRDKFDWAYLEDDVLNENDAVVISLPFADTGNKHINYHDLMRLCNDLKVPVLVDCAYFGVCSNIEFDFAYNCITDITFSLSKIFPVAHARIGIRFTKEDDDDTLLVYHKVNYNNKIGAAIGMKFMDKFSPDFIPNKYMYKQLEFCQYLNVAPSSTVLFGIGGDDWKKYNRGGATNRLSFHRQYIKGMDTIKVNG